MRLEGQVALVTGGAGGIGQAIIERLVAEGACVAVADIQCEAGMALAERLGKATRFVQLDVADDGQWTRAVDATIAAFGPLTCVVNNAGISVAGSISDTSDAAWRRTFEVNATGTFLGCRQGVAAMRGGGGTIINIASARGQRASSGQLAYCASKASVLALTESVALYCAEQRLNIRCNAVCPGIIDTHILDEVRARLGGGPDADSRLAGLQPVGRLGLPRDIAAMVAYLVSEEANFITGATFNVDGGFRIRDR
jgi:NAD(P)-dependent dehydrogenase (short-subunit alcohol dehydrogenase family)